MSFERWYDEDAARLNALAQTALDFGAVVDVGEGDPPALNEDGSLVGEEVVDNNCGTGAGGFKSGNTCGGDGSAKYAVPSLMVGRSTSPLYAPLTEHQIAAYNVVRKMLGSEPYGAGPNFKPNTDAAGNVHAPILAHATWRLKSAARMARAEKVLEWAKANDHIATIAGPDLVDDFSRITVEFTREPFVARDVDWRPDHVIPEDFYANAFCPTGKGGGVDPTCKKRTGHRGTDAALHEHENAAGNVREYLAMALWNAGYDPDDPPAEYEPDDSLFARRFASAHNELHGAGASDEELAPFERVLKAHGATTVGRMGEVSLFDGETMVGPPGSFPGSTRAKVVRPGWAYKGRPLVKADTIIVNKTYFGDCPRDDKGHCKDSGKADSANKGPLLSAPKPATAEPAKSKPSGPPVKELENANVEKKLHANVNLVKDSSGEKWVVKGRSGRAAQAKNEEVATKLAEKAGVAVVPVANVKLHGQDAMVSKFVEGQDFMKLGAGEALKRVPKEELDKHALFDYAIGSKDPNMGNYMLTKDGKMVALDKEQSLSMGMGGSTSFRRPEHLPHDYQFDRANVVRMADASEAMAKDLESQGLRKEAAGVRKRGEVLRKFAETQGPLTAAELERVGAEADKGAQAKQGAVGRFLGRVFG